MKRRSRRLPRLAKTWKRNERGRYEMNVGKGIKVARFERVRFSEIASTNEYAKSRRGEGKNLAVTAERQTGGKGTKGRSFSSEKGGVYLSMLTFYKDFPAKRAFEIMAGAAVAVCKTLRFYGLSPVIKWANDIYVNDKKICGILIENVFSGTQVHSSVVGIGLNVCNELPKELANIATTLQKETGRVFDVEEVTKRLLDELSKDVSIEEYRTLVGYVGREVVLILGDERVPATLLSVDDEGALHAIVNGEERSFHAAEVSLKI